MQLQMKVVEEACKELYIRALKVLPDDVKAGIERLNQGESDARAGAYDGVGPLPLYIVNFILHC
jgi:hypothetical protein